MALESNRHTNRHTSLLRISDLLEPASVKGLRRVGEIPLSTVWDFGGFVEMVNLLRILISNREYLEI
jgi:hypothetical protein